jgi:Ribosomal protein S14p/S29e
MHAYTRGTQIKNRCIDGGKGRGVFRDFRMARVGPQDTSLGSPYILVLHGVLIKTAIVSF